MNPPEETPAGAISTLDRLKEFTTVVADTGDFESIQEYSPQDATTNPTLIFRAVQQEEYAPILDGIVDANRGSNLVGDALIGKIVNELLISFGEEILKIIPGRVSTEVDARLSFDRDGTIAQAKEIIALYESRGISRERILIKIASTWEGISAAEALEQEGIHCNLTLLFSMAQAVACAEAKVTLISPFVGRIMDWYKAKTGQEYAAADDPGVHSVQGIYNYYKKFGYKTEVMGASFRNVGEILELAGCDLLTISPKFLSVLSESTDVIDRKLSEETANAAEIEKIEMNEKRFRWLLNEDAMGTEKLAEGIRSFAADIEKLEEIIKGKL